MLRSEGANEADVREEIAMPFLTALGYEGGSSNDILREVSLGYDKFFLGRKKKTDPTLRGRADYVLVVTGSARWTLEVKSPSEEITVDAIEQAISYAKHPEIAGSYASILNGKRFVVFHGAQASNDKPLIDLAVNDPNELATKVGSVLSPSAIRRDCSPPKIDLAEPLAEGFRSSANISGGAISYSDFVIRCNMQLPAPAAKYFGDISKKMCGYRSIITGGTVWRDDGIARIRAKLTWEVPHDEMLEFMRDKHLQDGEYISLSPNISSDPSNPTVFDIVGKVDIARGEKLFSPLTWSSIVAGFSTSMTYRGQALGSIRDKRFSGLFQTEYETRTPVMPRLLISFLTTGKFDLGLDPR